MAFNWEMKQDETLIIDNSDSVSENAIKKLVHVCANVLQIYEEYRKTAAVEQYDEI